MEKHIEPQVVLLAAEQIREKGVTKDGKHIYQQITLEVSYDGYTIIVRDPKVTLSLFFHNKVKIEYRHAQELDAFYERLIRLASSED